MAKIKHTKTELKAQSDALKRFQRFLPMLQLKKQQLQAEIADITAQLDKAVVEEQGVLNDTADWVAMFGDTAIDLESLVKVKKVVTDTGNIAGVVIPVFKSIETEVAPLDLFATPVWLDAAIEVLFKLISLRAKGAVLRAQRELIQIELQMTAQRVNLFEKVKIPECKENIRVIRIFLGDEQTAAVARGKIAKGRSADQPPPTDEEAVA